jgi:hypothetical protein
MERFFDGFAALETPGPAAFEEVGAEVGVAVVGPPLAQSDPSNARRTASNPRETFHADPVSRGRTLAPQGIGPD